MWSNYRIGYEQEKYKSSERVSLFDKEERRIKLSKLGNSLEKLHNVIDFEMFRAELEESMLNHDKKSPAGNKPYDVVMMFKIILLKRFYNMSNEQIVRLNLLPIKV